MLIHWSVVHMRAHLDDTSTFSSTVVSHVYWDRPTKICIRGFHHLPFTHHLIRHRLAHYRYPIHKEENKGYTRAAVLDLRLYAYMPSFQASPQLPIRVKQTYTNGVAECPTTTLHMLAYMDAAKLPSINRAFRQPTPPPPGTQQGIQFHTYCMPVSKPSWPDDMAWLRASSTTHDIHMSSAPAKTACSNQKHVHTQSAHHARFHAFLAA
jgi:hypothetical protein